MSSRLLVRGRRSEFAKDVELLVLRQLAVLRRQQPRPAFRALESGTHGGRVRGSMVRFRPFAGLSLMRPGGFEPPTNGLEGRRSVH